jgi:hypothetical protein
LRRALLDAADRAVRQLGRELHDGLGQDLVAPSLIARAETDRMKNGGARSRIAVLLRADSRRSPKLEGICTPRFGAYPIGFGTTGRRPSQ